MQISATDANKARLDLHLTLSGDWAWDIMFDLDVFDAVEASSSHAFAILFCFNRNSRHGADISSVTGRIR